jgi:hypothetical protein
MKGASIHVWLVLVHRVAGERGTPVVGRAELLHTRDGPGVGVDECLRELSALGAVIPLTRAELTAFASGDCLPSVVAIQGDNYLFVRVVVPRALQVRLAAERELLRVQIAARKPLPPHGPTVAEQIAPELGLTADQLVSGTGYSLSEEEWDRYKNMPTDFFGQTWKRMKASGNAQALVRLAAAVSRMHVEELAAREREVWRGDAEGTRFNELTAALHLIDSVASGRTQRSEDRV